MHLKSSFKMNLTTYQELYISNAYSIVQTAAPKYLQVKGRYLVTDLLEFLHANPNASNHELGTFLGTTDDNAGLLYAIGGSWFPEYTNLTSFLTYLRDALPYMPNMVVVKPRGFDAIIFTFMAIIILVITGRLYSRYRTTG